MSSFPHALKNPSIGGQLQHEILWCRRIQTRMSRYTYARLQDALEAFRDSEPYRTRRGLGARNLERHLRSYDTRKAFGPFVARSVGIWVDRDDSGDYDPGQEKKRGAGGFMPKSRRAKRQAEEVGFHGDGNSNAKRVKTRTWQRGCQRGKTKKVTFKLNSEKGKKMLRGIRDDTKGGDRLCKRSDVNHTSLEQLPGPSGPLENDQASLSPCSRRHSSPKLEKDEEDEFASFGIRLRTRAVPAPNHLDVERKCAACDQCRRAKKRCSVRRSQTGPCHSCRREIIPCTFEMLHTTESQAETKSVEAGASQPITASSTPFETQGYTTTLTTHWCHPVDYEFKVPADFSRLCHFCSDPRYGIFGLGRITIEVIAYPDSVAYEELGGGHREAGTDPTRMCISCGIERLRISRCEKHEIFALSCDEKTFDKIGAFNDLRHKSVRHPWCSLCYNPAFHSCAREQTRDRFGRPVTPSTSAEEREGCGLWLCSECAGDVHHYGMNRSNLEFVIRECGRQLRADFDFLFAGSDLHKAHEQRMKRLSEQLIRRCCS